MTATVKRSFWQIHLTTVVVLMFVSGMILWVNLTARRPDIIPQFVGTGLEHEVDGISVFGWPFEFAVDMYRGNLPPPNVLSPTHATFDFRGLFGDLIIGLFLVSFAVFACEFAGRRANKKLGSSPDTSTLMFLLALVLYGRGL